MGNLNDEGCQELKIVSEAEERLRDSTPEIPNELGLHEILKNPEWESRFDQILEQVRIDYDPQTEW